MSVSASSDAGRDDPSHPPLHAHRSASGGGPLRIVHCLRAPVGGLFRHVRDLAAAQQAAGHMVGLVCDSTTGGALEADLLERLAPDLSLGLLRTPMRRSIGPSDLATVWRISHAVRQRNPDVLHGHGAKGGAFARAVGTFLRATGKRVARIYTPHGGSLHYDPRSTAGRVFFAAERLLAHLTDAFVFVSQYEADTFADKVGTPRRPVFLARNGLRAGDFDDVPVDADAADFLYIGELRDLKGTDVLIAALARLAKDRQVPPTAVIVGGGSDAPRFRAMAADRGLADRIAFRDPTPARKALRFGRILVVPSRAESMPYVVLEALGAGRAVIATRVGGLPEIFGDLSHRLVAAGDAEALAGRMTDVLTDEAAARRDSAELRRRLADTFTVGTMAANAEAAYRQAIAR